MADQDPRELLDDANEAFRAFIDLLHDLQRVDNGELEHLNARGLLFLLLPHQVALEQATRALRNYVAPLHVPGPMAPA